MNKSLLLIICDFLLLSLLGFVQFDIPESSANEIEVSAPTEQPKSVEEDLIEALQLLLDEQREIQSNLTRRIYQLMSKKSWLRLKN